MVSFVAKTVLFCALLLNCVHALHFYLDALERRCFIEELPTDTIVEGKPIYYLFDFKNLLG